MPNHRRKTINCTLTRRVIDLHSLGYTEDFWDRRDRRMICLQNGECFDANELIICLVDLGFDQLSQTYRYIHTVETHGGAKGLLIAGAIYPMSLTLIN